MGKFRSDLITIALVIGTLAACQGEPSGDPIASAKSALAKGDSKAAMVQLKTALQKNPGSGEARFLMGQALADQGNAQAAVFEFKKAEELGFDEVQLAPKYARVLLSTGQFKAVIDKFSGRALADPSAKAELRTALALSHAGLGDRKQAQRELEGALADASTHPWVLRAKANFVAAEGNLDEALKIVDQSLEPGKPNGDAWLLRGEILRNGKRDLAGAQEAFDKALKDPQSALAARYALVELHLSRGALKEARTQVEALGKVAPRLVRTAYLDALLSYEEGNFKRAKEQAQRLVTQAPSEPRFRFLAGSADLRRGALIEAESALGRAVSLAPTWRQPRWHLAETYLQLGQPAKARAALAPIAEGDKPDANALSLLATTYLHEGDLARADALFTRAASLNPDDVSIRTAVALSTLAKGKADQAFSELQSIASTDQGVTADMALISAHLRRKEHEKALAAIERLKSKQPSSPVPEQLRGVTLLYKGDTVFARQAFEGALKADPKYFAAVANLAALDMAESKFADARQRVQAAITLDPGNTAARLTLTSILVREGAPPKDVRAVLEEAIRANPSEPAPRLAMLALLRETRDVKGALAAAQDALSALPDQPDVVDAVGQVQAVAGEHQQAVSTFNKLANLRPASPVPYLRLADLQARRGDQAAVVASLRRAIDVAPESAEVHRRLVAQAVKSKDASTWIGTARDIQQRHPQRAAGYLLEGDLYTVAKNYRSAESAYRKALDKPEPTQRAAVSVYLSLASQGQPDEAERFVSGWLQTHPKDVGTRVRLGEMAFWKRDVATAERRFNEVLAIEPLHVGSLNFLAMAQVDRGDKGALTHARRAATLAPHDPNVQATLSKALLLNGRNEDAVSVSRRAVSLSGGQPDLRLELARTYLKVGMVDKAKAELDALAALGATFHRASEVSSLRKGL